ncbi:LacI family DNA-binding transcriptional regulator [Alicyclobacillus fodiniaquatilis]|jgi:DNA-binding LacI/PurR family transcriptional regulator|uniref:LacI family DNA-binding transcriptional regulator n=1 Tax=Alicyclobacillus fodiniaquatilis TaxID=1661150 RepID=A0ABW4JNE5_9BACL
MTPTIKDVAKLANTSKSTVSRYLNGKPVKKQTEEAVRRAIAELNYHPNMNARRLVLDKTQEIGIVVDDITNRFYSAILKGVRRILDANGYDCVFYTLGLHHRKETDFLDLLYEGQVDGLIFVSFMRRSEDDVEEMKASSFPVVLIGDDAGVNEIPSIDVDNSSGVIDVVNYLYRIGHRDIAYISGPDGAAATKARMEGYQASIARLGLKLNPDLIVVSDWSNKGGYTAMQQLLEVGGFTAVVASNDESAFGAMSAMQEQGYNIPKDFSIVGFDDIDISSWSYPSLTTVRQPFEQMGSNAAQMLLEMIDSDGERSYSRDLLKPQLIVRSSCLTL